MIGYLKGLVIEKKRNEVWLLCGQVGYRVRIGESLNQKLTPGSEVELFIHTAVRDDALDLYGFFNVGELQLFELIISVSGVGPKIGLAIMGQRSVEQIQKAVQEADVAFFQKIPGIGKKGAQRIIVDLKGKLPSIKDLDLTEDESEDEVVEALRQFGFTAAEVMAVMGDLDPQLSSENRIREGLKRLGRRR